MKISIEDTGQLLKQIYKEVEQLIYEGQTLKNLDNEIGLLYKKYSVQSAIPEHFNFPGNCCLSLNDIACHGVPNNSRLKDTDVLKVDIAIRSIIPESNVVDACRTFFLPKALKKYKNMYSFAQKLVHKAASHIIPNKTTVAEHSAYVYNQIKQSNTYKLLEDFCGHFVSTEMHAGYPICYNPKKLIDISKNRVFKEGDCFTIEPILLFSPTYYNIHEDGFSVRTRDIAVQYEDTFLIQDYNLKVVT